MKRGEVWWVSFDPSVGSEIRKTRPAVIVSNDLSNQYSRRFQVIPATSATKKLYPCECLAIIGKQKSKFMADQIMTASKERFQGYICTLSDDAILELNRVLKLQLGLLD